MKPTPELARGFENVYDPAEDSFFLLDCLEKDEEFLQSYARARGHSLLVAELGTGTGIVSSFVPQVLSDNYIALAADINPAACKCASESWSLNWPQHAGLNVVRGNLLDWIRPGLIDVLLFNPPYVPSETVPSRPKTDNIDDDQWVDLALDGGEDGMEITNIVLDELDSKLATGGIAYILFCASNHPQKVCADMESRGWSSYHVDTRRAGWEILSVYRFSKVSKE